MDKKERFIRELEACRRSIQNIECYQRVLLLVAKQRHCKRASLGGGA